MALKASKTSKSGSRRGAGTLSALIDLTDPENPRKVTFRAISARLKRNYAVSCHLSPSNLCNLVNGKTATVKDSIVEAACSAARDIQDERDEKARKFQ